MSLSSSVGSKATVSIQSKLKEKSPLSNHSKIYCYNIEVPTNFYETFMRLYLNNFTKNDFIFFKQKIVFNLAIGV